MLSVRRCQTGTYHREVLRFVARYITSGPVPCLFGGLGVRHLQDGSVTGAAGVAQYDSGLLLTAGIEQRKAGSFRGAPDVALCQAGKF